MGGGQELHPSAHFGRPGLGKGERSAFPQTRVVALAECGTHAMLEAAIRPYTTSANDLAAEVLARLAPVMLCLTARASALVLPWTSDADQGDWQVWRTYDLS